MNNSKEVFLEADIARKAFQIGNAICCRLRKRYFIQFVGGDSSDEVIESLKRYLNALLWQIRIRFRLHSKYFLLYHFRRLRAVFQLMPIKLFDWEQADHRAFMREMLGCSWLYHRISLAIIKYGISHGSDMEILPPRFSGSTGYGVPKQLTSKDTEELLVAHYLMAEFETTRYCLKRAGKGGKFIWKDRPNLVFDIEFGPYISDLANIYDDRLTTGDGLLGFNGIWAPTQISQEFPLPGGLFAQINPQPGGVSLSDSRLFSNTPVILALCPNVAGQGRDLGWQDPTTKAPTEMPPPWLFQWFHPESMMPRLELFRGAWKKHLEFSGRPCYEPEDLVFALSALTAYQVRSCQESEVIWHQIFTKGYSIWSMPYEVLRQFVLPEYANQKERSGVSSSSLNHWETLLSVIEDIKWDEKKAHAIDILRFSPVNLIFPIDEDSWLIDWSLMLELILNLFSFCGRVTGTTAILRGKELQSLLGEYFQSHASQLGISIWRPGHQKGLLVFNNLKRREADIVFLVDDCLLIVEVKSHSANRELVLIGDPNKFTERWDNIILPALNQVDTLADAISKEPKGRNFELPNSARWVVPIVCGPFSEWIPSKDNKWWLYKDLPRICRPDELLETITRIKNGDLPSYKLEIIK